jgi:hypothetical protein
MNDGRRCGHSNCGCPRACGESPYCGAYCANADKGESLPGEADFEGSCACGHDACRSREPEAAGEEVVTSTGRP